MSETEAGGEGSPASTDEPVEAPGLTTEDGEVIPPIVPADEPIIVPADEPISPPQPKPPAVDMFNGKKKGRVFPFKDRPIEAGEAYSVSETKAKKMEKIPGNYRL